MVSQIVSTRSRAAIEQAIGAFTAADWVRLRRVAQRYAWGHPIPADDLLQEALLRALTTRKCPDDVDVIKFLAEAMRSIAHGEEEKAESRPTIAEASGFEDPEDPLLKFPDPSRSPEDVVIDHQIAATIRHTLRALFEDDPAAWIILEGDMEGLSVAELRELTELDMTAYNSKRKLIRRRINKAFPEGWKP